MFSNAVYEGVMSLIVQHPAYCRCHRRGRYRQPGWCRIPGISMMPEAVISILREEGYEVEMDPSHAFSYVVSWKNRADKIDRLLGV